VHHQWSLLPQIVDLLLAHPVQALLGDADIKVPQHPHEDDAHLNVRQATPLSEKNHEEVAKTCDSLSPQTISRSNMERLKRLLVVAGKRRVAQPSLGVVLEWVLEEFVAVIHGPVVD